MDIELIAASVVSTIAPFTPFLVETGKEGAKELAKKIAEKGGEAAWNKAQDLWKRINSRLGNDPKVKGAALMVSAEPNDEDSQKMLTTILIKHLKKNSELAQELFDLLGEQTAIQEVIADQKSKISDVVQQSGTGGNQTVKATRSSQIKGVKQITK